MNLVTGDMMWCGQQTAKYKVAAVNLGRDIATDELVQLGTIN
jgi:hypothetical protein